MKFYIVDCFAEKKYKGNQLAVFILDRWLPEKEMQQIAREMNFSEVTFILSDLLENGGYNARIFTPYIEVPFAGHPVIGTAFVIENYIEKRPLAEIKLNLLCGQIPIRKIENRYCMIQNQPVFIDMVDKRDVALAISLPISAIASNLPIQCVSTGLEAIITPLKSVAEFEACAVNYSAMEALHINWRKCNLLVYTIDGSKLRVRVFMDEPGYLEDPATGSANGNLAAYLLFHNVFQSTSINYIVHQGLEIGRSSILFINASLKDGVYDIKVGGKVFPVATGEWL